jgi:CheY-like chemotaxis protein
MNIIRAPPGPSAAALADAGEAAAPPQLPGKVFPFSVLAIEDETSVRTALGRLLKAKGIEATLVATAAHALALISEQRLNPDLLLCDYNLRGSPDGVTTIHHLRAALGRDVPAVVMTGDTRTQTVNSIAAQGVAVLIKPFMAEELLDAMRSHALKPAAAGGMTCADSILKPENGGRDRDRTCDPLDVNEVLSR